MAAIFREVAPCSGVDENLPTAGQGIVVPSGGSTLVILEDTVEMKELPKGFLDERDSGSALTFFLVRKVTNGGTADNGATNAKERVSLIADSRSDSTMAHEGGHFLGTPWTIWWR